MTISAPTTMGVATASSECEAPGKSSKPLILLIPWDPDSPEHIERMKQQRISCGWKVEAVENWREQQREGKIGLHWIVLTPSQPDTSSRLQQHAETYPKESTPLQDTCKLVLSRMHTPDPPHSSFIPIGHISLDVKTPFPELRTSAPDGVYSIMSFYISTALQSGGLGAAALISCENMAVTKFGAKTITLGTICNSECTPNNPRRIAMGNNAKISKPTNEDWYKRRGYKVYERKPDAWFDTDPTGKRWGVTGIFMRKDLDHRHCEL